MNKVEVHNAWARPERRWSSWVKPILFAGLDESRAPEAAGPPPAWLSADVLDPLAAVASRGESYRRSADLFADVALVVDLPGAEGTRVGIALAAQGFAPIPLYNAFGDETEVVDTLGMRHALIDGADAVRDVRDTAPPAFLLDANRRGSGRPIGGGDFDNRSFCLPGDFPSADALWDAGIRRAVLIQRGNPWPAADLAPTLLDWRRRGVALFLARADSSDSLAPLASVHPPWPVRIKHRVERLFFKPRTDGGFGELVPLPVHSAG